MLEKFPHIQTIANKENIGFSGANNQAIRISKAQYVLLLNPDTVVEEDTFLKTIRFMDSHPQAGGLGVKMIDGKGNFLPESKRSLPTPLVSFYKMFGFSRIFPKSKTFGKYHLSYLSKDKIHEVDVLSGAFMLLRMETLEKTGLLDETFFMYGEDIDLSYRIQKSGYKNYYFPETTIIHYKGESTKKGSLNYIYVFYNAMLIFARKHFTGNNAKMFALLIKIAIFFRAGLSVVKKTLERMFLPVFDFISFYAGFYIGVPIWEEYKFAGGGSYPPEYMNFAVPAYILIWISAIGFFSGYKPAVKVQTTGKAIVIGTFCILVIYSLLDETYRYSRALILLGALWAVISSFTGRFIFKFIGLKKFGFAEIKKRRIAIIADETEKFRITEILKNTDLKHIFVGNITKEQAEGSIGKLDNLNEIIRVYKIDEIIFSLNYIGTRDIIKYVLSLENRSVDIKIAPHQTLTLIGSNSIHTSGDLYSVDFNSLGEPANRRKKRTFDISVSLLFIVFYPILFLVSRKNKIVFNNIFSVLSGKKTWVGYNEQNNILPKIKNPVFTFSNSLSDTENNSDADSYYAKSYKVMNDINTILKKTNKFGFKKNKPSL